MLLCFERFRQNYILFPKPYSNTTFSLEERVSGFSYQENNYLHLIVEQDTADF